MAEGKRAREVRSVGNTVAMVAESERIEGIQQIEVAWSRVPGAESTRLHTAHPKPPVPLLLVHSLARFPYPLSFFLHRLPDSLTLLPTCRHSPARNPFPLIPVLTVVISSLLCSSLLFATLPTVLRCSRLSPSRFFPTTFAAVLFPSFAPGISGSRLFRISFSFFSFPRILSAFAPTSRYSSVNPTVSFDPGFRVHREKPADNLTNATNVRG